MGRQLMRTNAVFPFRTALSTCCTVFTIAMVLVFPLMIHNAYYDLTKTKLVTYAVCSALLILAALVCLIGSWVTKKERPARGFFRSLSVSDWAMTGFWICCGMSCIVSNDPKGSFWGSQARMFGFALVTMFFVVYFLLSRFYKQSQATVFALLIGCSAVGLIGIFNHFGADPFSLLAQVPLEKRGMFISTLGNVNFFASFFCIMLPISAASFLYCTTAFSKVLYGTASAVSAGAVVCSNSDGAAIAVVLFFCALLFFSLRSRTRLRSFCLVTAIILFTLRVIGILQRFIPSAIELSPLSSWLAVSMGGFYLFVLALAGVGAAWFAARNTAGDALHRRWRLLWGIVCAAAFAAVIVSVLYFSFVDRQTPLGTLGAYLRIDDAWGTNRGYVWRCSLEAFRELPLPQILFGHGLDSVLSLLRGSYEQTVALYTFPFDSVHNEYLQYLVTIGVFGALCYAVYLISLLIRAVRSKNSWACVLAAGVFGYAVQAFFNLAQPATTPLFFCVAALVESALREQAKAKEK